MTQLAHENMPFGAPNTPLPFGGPQQDFAPQVDARAALLEVLNEWRLKPNDTQVQMLVQRVGETQVRTILPTFKKFALLTLSTGDREYVIYHGKDGKETNTFSDATRVADWLAERQRKGS